MKMHQVMMSAALAAVVGGISTANAEFEVTGSAAVDVVSDYVFRGETLSDEVNVQPGIEVDISGVTAGTWGTFDTDTEQFQEIDYYLSYDLPLGEDAPVGASIGYTEYTYQNTGAAMVEADREVNIGLSLADCVLSPTLGVNVGFDGALKDGIYLELGLSHDIEVGEDVEVGLSVAVGYQAGERDMGGVDEETGISHATITAATAVGPGTLSVSYVAETDDDVLVVDQDVVIGLGLSF